MNDLEKRIRALEARDVPDYCPEAAGFRLRDNYDFGCNIERIDQLADLCFDKLPYPGAEDHLPSNGEYQRYRPIGTGFHLLDTDAGLLRMVAKPAITDTGELIIGSAMVRAKQTVKYGFFEARFRCLGGPTIWPAWWLLPANGAWPPEIDWFDSPENADPNRETSRMVHLGVVAAAGRTDKVTDSKLDQWSDYRSPGLDWGRDFVTIGGYWHGQDIAHFVNGVCVRRGMFDWLDSNGADPGDAFMVLNLAIGGNWPGKPTAATFTVNGTAVLEVDYIRHWVP
jgi:hypothetical protein